MRSLIFTSATAPGARLRRKVADLLEDDDGSDDVVVAVHDRGDMGDRSLPCAQRFAAVRHVLRDEGRAIPTVWTKGMLDDADIPLAFHHRFGPSVQLFVDDPELARRATALGLNCTLDASLGGGGDAPPRLTDTKTHALVVSRAQPFHQGHRALVDAALAAADEVVVVIAAADRAYGQTDPLSAGERLGHVWEALADVRDRVWLVALPTPAEAALALPQLRRLVPAIDVVVARNPVLLAMAEAAGLKVLVPEAVVDDAGIPISGTALRGALAKGELPTGLAPAVATRLAPLAPRFRRLNP